MNLTEQFHALHKEAEENPQLNERIATLILNAPDSAERSGLMALIYHEGIGVEADLDKSFEYAEKALEQGGDPAAYFILGYMCDNAETPDQATGGPRQKYDHYDAERFYAKCAETESRWRKYACLWLGDYFTDSARGGDPDAGIEYYEAVADTSADAAGALSDYYWDLVMPLYFEDDEWRAQLFKWTTKATELDPEEYSYRLGWLYADGLGCEKSPADAIEHFLNAAELGEWRGAEAAAKVVEEYLEENPETDEARRQELLSFIDDCRRQADEMCAKEIAEEPDPSIDDD